MVSSRGVAVVVDEMGQFAGVVQRADCTGDGVTNQTLVGEIMVPAQVKCNDTRYNITLPQLLCPEGGSQHAWLPTP